MQPEVSQFLLNQGTWRRLWEGVAGGRPPLQRALLPIQCLGTFPGESEAGGGRTGARQVRGITQLTLDGQRFLSLMRNKSKYGSYVEDKINEVVNAAAERYLGEIRDAVKFLAFGNDYLALLDGDES